MNVMPITAVINSNYFPNFFPSHFAKFCGSMQQIFAVLHRPIYRGLFRLCIKTSITLHIKSSTIIIIVNT